MKIIKTAAELRAWRAELPQEARLGFVPTMGALHAGHLSLVEAAMAANTVVLASIFVNPTQFDRPDDLAAYPRQEAQDLALLEAAGCHAVFMPEAQDIYPQGEPRVHLSLPYLSEIWEGASRPVHFAGVALVVTKLLMLAQPHHLYMGQKDFQQTVVIRSLIDELFIPTTLVVCPTLREDDGLAMSSRNQRLSATDRQHALALYRTLQHMARQWQANASPEQIVLEASVALQHADGCRLDYVALIDAHTLAPVQQRQDHSGSAMAVVAVFVGPVRLIDCLPMPA